MVEQEQEDIVKVGQEKDIFKVGEQEDIVKLNQEIDILKVRRNRVSFAQGKKRPSSSR